MLSKRHLKNVIRWPLILLGLMWVVFLIDQYLMGGYLSYQYALRTREIVGLPGIIAAPLLHSGWPHLLSNTFPFAALGGLLIFFYPRLWPRVLTTLWLGTGAAVWVLARPVAHIGMSGVVYALAGFLAFSGIFRRDFRAIVVSLIVLFYYGGLAAGLLPGQEGISWESHLFGFLLGAGSAWLFRNNLEDHEIAKRRADAERRKPQPKSHFLAADTFTKTKAERAEEARQLAAKEEARKQAAFFERLERIREEDRLRR